MEFGERYDLAHGNPREGIRRERRRVNRLRPLTGAERRLRNAVKHASGPRGALRVIAAQLGRSDPEAAVAIHDVGTRTPLPSRLTVPIGVKAHSSPAPMIQMVWPWFRENPAPSWSSMTRGLSSEGHVHN